DVDLDLTLDRGRITLTNHKESGEAKVRLHAGRGTGLLTLAKPGDSLALELYGRWLPGVPFTKHPKPEDRPFTTLDLLVLKGEVMARIGSDAHALRAPPGPALIEMDNVHGADASPQHVEKLPPWASNDAQAADPPAKRKALVEKFRRGVVEHGLEATLEEVL